MSLSQASKQKLRGYYEYDVNHDGITCTYCSFINSEKNVAYRDVPIDLGKNCKKSLIDICQALGAKSDVYSRKKQDLVNWLST
jgi:hypothetical protein